MDDSRSIARKRTDGVDIRERTFRFAVRIVRLVGKLPRTVAGIEIGRQLVRAGTSVGANMREADEALSKKDFINHVRIARKEARESKYWLALIAAACLLNDPEIGALTDEAGELVRILSAINASAIRTRGVGTAALVIGSLVIGSFA
jgi:four helix bundle protein